MYTSKMGAELEGLGDDGVPMGILELPLFHHDIHREPSALLSPVLRPHTVSQTGIFGVVFLCAVYTAWT
jgi:hypothetical protein